jgi:hypothetical protein
MKKTTFTLDWGTLDGCMIGDASVITGGAGAAKILSFGCGTGNPSATQFSAFPEPLATTGWGWGE